MDGDVVMHFGAVNNKNNMMFVRFRPTQYKLREEINSNGVSNKIIDEECDTELKIIMIKITIKMFSW